MSINRRTATINGEKIAYTYNTANRVVTVRSLGIEFIATCYDAAKDELAEALAETSRPAEVAAEPAERTDTAIITPATTASVAPLPNMFVTSNLRHEVITLADGTYAPKCRNRATKGRAEYAERPSISCNSCTGAHLSGTHLGM